MRDQVLGAATARSDGSSVLVGPGCHRSLGGVGGARGMSLPGSLTRVHPLPGQV